jgi:hypothetical protein
MMAAVAVAAALLMMAAVAVAAALLMMAAVAALTLGAEVKIMVEDDKSAKLLLDKRFQTSANKLLTPIRRNMNTFLSCYIITRKLNQLLVSSL